MACTLYLFNIYMIRFRKAKANKILFFRLKLKINFGLAKARQTRPQTRCTNSEAAATATAATTTTCDKCNWKSTQKMGKMAKHTKKGKL